MPEASDGKRHFFISYNKADQAWAEWVGAMLEQAGYTILLDVWDFTGNFVVHMHGAETRAERTVALLSDNYFRSDFTLGEWTARYARDPAMREDRLIPVVVGPVSQANLLDPILHADLFACGRDEGRARETLLERIARATDPAYGAKRRKRPHAFPGRAEAAAQPPATAPPRFPVPLHNLPPQNPDFVGREEVLAWLHELLSPGQGPTVLTQAITGLGGVGKTQTALAYAYRHLADYRLVWWLRAEDAATLAADYSALAGPLGLDPAAANQDKLRADIRHALQAVDGWLLIFDNVEDPALPRVYLPTTGQGHALITSRRTDWQGLAKARELAVMTEGEALQLLTGRPDPDTLPAAERAAAAALAKELGYLPLALAQARAYMAGTGKSLARYRQLFEASRPAVLERGRASLDYPASVAKTWQISIAAAAGECAAARSLLELLAFFAPETLPVEVLASAPATLPDGLDDELARDDAIAALHRFSLLRAEAGRLTVHRLVQAVTRDGLDAATAKAHALAAVQLVSAALPHPSWEHTNWPAIGALLPHALATAEAAERLGAGLETAATVLNAAALCHFARAAYAEAEPLYQRALTIRKQVLGPEHPAVATSLHNLAVLYTNQGRFAEAEALYQRALAIREQALGPKHRRVATSLNNLATFYTNQGRYAEAEPLYQRALAVSEQALGPEHPDVATSLNNLAALYTNQGRFAEAEPLYQRALAIQEQTLGPEHLQAAQSLHNLAVLYDNQDRFAEAEPLYQRALAIREKVLGLEHSTTATSLHNLAALYINQGRFAEAEPLYRRALQIVEKTLPANHPHRMRDRENYAGLLDQLGRPAEAAELRAQAQAIR